MTELTSFSNSVMGKSDDRVGNSVMEKPDDREPLRPSMGRSISSFFEEWGSKEVEEWNSTDWMLTSCIVFFIILIFPLDPRDPDMFAVSSIFHVLLDPLLLYVPLINEDNKCVMVDHRLKIAAIVLRSFGDVRYLVRIILRIKDGWRASHSLYKIAMSNAIDTVSILPIPQVAILIFLPNMRGADSLKILKLLNSLILLQYLTRVYPIYRMCKEVNADTHDTKIPNKLEWKRLSIAINFSWYLLASHVLGAFWYFFSIQREIDCWGSAGRIENGSEFSTSCDEKTFKNITLLNNQCPINPPNTTIFDFGIFLYALQSGMQGSTNFPQKFLQCFSWGLRNLSSFASNLNTSTYGWENCFVVLISISGLVLFIYLLGHVQTFMQGTNISDSLRRKMELIIEPKIQFMLSVYGLPKEMESKVKRVVKAKLEANEDLVVENMSSILSSDIFGVEEAEDLAMEIKCSLFMDKLEKVDGLKYKGEEVLKKICAHLQPMIYSEGCYIIREGEPLDMMFFITIGTGLTYATNNGSSGTIQFEKEKDGLYGEELLTWAEGPSSKLSNLPISPVTVKSHKKVEVFAIKATDLQLVVSKFRTQFNKDNTLTVAVDNVIVN